MKVNEIITSRFVQALSQDVIPWRKPWHTSCYRNAISGKPYHGVNVLTLALCGNGNAYLTYKQANLAGGHVNKGATSLPIVFCAPYVKQDETKGETRQALALRYYNVFALEDCTMPESFEAKGNGPTLQFQPIAQAESLVALQNAHIEHKGQRACYSPKEHMVYMPAKTSFLSVEQYYVTLFHELIHREAKELGQELSSSMELESYSKEELVAEIGANFLAGFCGIDTSSIFDNSKAYIQGWTKQLSGNPQLIISAASQAQKRFDSILKKAGMLKEEKLETVEA